LSREIRAATQDARARAFVQDGMLCGSMIYVQQMAKYTAFRCNKFQWLSQTQQGRNA
jgi:hypothetical protein